MYELQSLTIYQAELDLTLEALDCLQYLLFLSDPLSKNLEYSFLLNFSDLVRNTAVGMN